MQAVVSTGVMKMNKFTHQFKQGVKDVHKISGKIESIISEMQALTARFQQVSNPMGNRPQGEVLS